MRYRTTILWLGFFGSFYLESILAQDIDEQEFEAEDNPENENGLLIQEHLRDNCTRCMLWKGHHCRRLQPCITCNETMPCGDSMECRYGICSKLPYRVSPTGDPLGKVIALITLTIFLLSLLTFCLRVFANSCGDRRCCVVQCAISLQCCCEWKAGRLRILPNSPGHNTHPRDSGGIDQQYRTNGRRASLYPPPPPTYVELFPEGRSETLELTFQANEEDESSPNTDQDQSDAISHPDIQQRRAQTAPVQRQRSSSEVVLERYFSNPSEGAAAAVFAARPQTCIWTSRQSLYLHQATPESLFATSVTEPPGEVATLNIPDQQVIEQAFVHANPRSLSLRLSSFESAPPQSTMSPVEFGQSLGEDWSSPETSAMTSVDETRVTS
ncbi:uncharacterized protein LOC131887744 isoform X2 [Tigriopus californicus]|uniref:uncharacterized protein LOC131887744 isoform X2 n=1 Tax=Tigriopus californicus TaxID=6832 RepID=UPI0027D9FBB7|nr:uncharacterized protein LOC131887744 isoform X2 [Tigriopus californicus]